MVKSVASAPATPSWVAIINMSRHLTYDKNFVARISSIVTANPMRLVFSETKLDIPRNWKATEVREAKEESVGGERWGGVPGYRGGAEKVRG